MSSTSNNPKLTVIIALWRHRLNLSTLRKSDNIRILVVAPQGFLMDETNIDVLYLVEPPSRDQHQLLNKVRELCTLSASTDYRIIVFERSLQKSAAMLRHEMSIEGIRPEQLEQLLKMKELKTAAKRAGLTITRNGIFGASTDAEIQLERTREQVGTFPVFMKPVQTAAKCLHTMRIAHNEEEDRALNPKYLEYFVEECLDNGHDFTAICSRTGLLGIICTINAQHSLYENVRDQLPYALEYLNTEQTRDAFPGVESFVLHCLKSIFSKNMSGLIFVKGFYKGHNNIYFMSVSLEPTSSTVVDLFHFAKRTPWEVIALENLCDLKQQNGEVSECDSSRQNHHLVVNFPSSEGVLLHQTGLRRRSTSMMRVAWRVAEGQELNDCDSIDDNVLQVFLSNPDRTALLSEAADLIENTDITIDRLSLHDKHNVCRRLHHADTITSYRLPVAGPLVRASTTAD